MSSYIGVYGANVTVYKYRKLKSILFAKGREYRFEKNKGLSLYGTLYIYYKSEEDAIVVDKIVHPERY